MGLAVVVVMVPDLAGATIWAVSGITLVALVSFVVPLIMRCRGYIRAKRQLRNLLPECKSAYEEDKEARELLLEELENMKLTYVHNNLNNFGFKLQWKSNWSHQLLDYEGLINFLSSALPSVYQTHLEEVAAIFFHLSRGTTKVQLPEQVAANEERSDREVYKEIAEINEKKYELAGHLEELAHSLANRLPKEISASSLHGQKRDGKRDLESLSRTSRSDSP